MALAYFTPNPRPSPGTENTPELKILSAQFGDGYTQETPDGINHIRSVWRLKWDALTPAQADAIEAFFVAQKGTTPFWWKEVSTGPWIKVTCKEWSRTRGAPHTVTATLRQSFSNAT